MIIALAGRRIDAPNAEIRRFPPENLELVRTRIRSFLQANPAALLISSAACGADLIALEEADAMGLQRRIVLPFHPQRFRVTSVTDRPGNWGVLYDRVVEEAQRKGELVILGCEDESAAYTAVNHAILDEAERLARAEERAESNRVNPAEKRPRESAFPRATALTMFRPRC